jgi:hypothetical protein
MGILMFNVSKNGTEIDKKKRETLEEFEPGILCSNSWA